LWDANVIIFGSPISGLSRPIASRYLAGDMSGGRQNFSRRSIGAVLLAAASFFAAPPTFTAHADVVVLRSGRAYAGVIERETSRTVCLFDGNLRRLFALGNVEKIIRERPDTSWVIVGDIMLSQGDLDSAGAAYRKALALTDQPDVILQRFAKLRAVRFGIVGAEQAEKFLAAGEFENAARALHNVARRAKSVAQKRYWAERLARAYVGLAEKVESSPTIQVNPFLLYALSIAPTCAPAHRLLGERLERLGFRSEARFEFLLALDLDPLEEGAKAQLEKLGVRWRFDPKKRNRSGLRGWIEAQKPLGLDEEAPLTTGALAAAIRRRVARLGRQPARLLLASYLVEPTAALAYDGVFLYPGYRKTIRGILRETNEPSGETPYDKAVIAAAIKVKIDPRFVRAIAKVLSACKVEYVSPTGARGLVPLTRRQWRIAARLAGKNWDFERDSADPEKNLALACRYLDWLRREVLGPYAGGRLDHLERVHDNF